MTILEIFSIIAVWVGSGFLAVYLHGLWNRFSKDDDSFMVTPLFMLGPISLFSLFVSFVVIYATDHSPNFLQAIYRLGKGKDK